MANGVNRISKKRLARLGKIPYSTIAPKKKQAQAVKHIPDAHHERGYREMVNAVEMRKRLALKVEEQHKLCGICWLPLPDDLAQIDPDHIVPKGMGGAWHDSHSENLQAVHRPCNLQKGSSHVPDRLLLIGPYFLYVEGLECFCGQPKQSRKPVCFECFSRLSGQLQHDLNTLTGREHASALVNAKEELEGKREKIA